MAVPQRTRSSRRPPAGRPPKSTKKTGQSTNSLGASPWEGLFASRTLASLLKVLLIHSHTAFYQRELARAVDARLYTVQRELKRLEQAGLVTRTRRGNRVYYRADHAHPAFQDLQRVFLKTIALGDALREALGPLRDRVQVALVYGSFARGDERADSDVDLLLVGELTPREAAAVLAPAGRDLGRELNATVYSPQELARKAGQGHHFIQTLLHGEKLFLIGDADDLERLAG